MITICQPIKQLFRIKPVLPVNKNPVQRVPPSESVIFHRYEYIKFQPVYLKSGQKGFLLRLMAD